MGHTNGMKAQVSFEFMVVYTALLSIFLVVFAVYFDGSLNLFQSQDTMIALQNAHTLAAAINYVHLAGDGASYNFTFANLANEEGIIISDYAVTASREHGSAGAPLLSANVNVSTVERNMVLTNNEGEINIAR